MWSACSAVAVLFLIKPAFGIPGEPVMYLPPFEVRTLDMGMGNRVFPFTSSSSFIPASTRIISQPPMSMQSQQQMMMSSPQQSIMPSQQQASMMSTAQQESIMPSQQQQSIMSSAQQLPPQQQQPMMSPQQQSMMAMQQQPSVLHTTEVPPPAPDEDVRERPHERHNFTLNEFVEVLNEISEHNEVRPGSRDYESSLRAAEERGAYPGPPPPPQPPSYPPYSSYSRPYAPPPRPTYPSYSQPPAPAPAYNPPAAPAYNPPALSPASKTVDISSFLKPVSTKAGSKLSGLLGLVLSLFSGSGSDDLMSKGFKEIIINGIIKPLLVAKGGIKALISKLAIPVIALLLINVEVLITVWWLWEECPKETYPTSYSKPTYSSSYHSYR